MSKLICRDCPEYLPISNTEGQCFPINNLATTFTTGTSPICRLHRRELEALAKAKRLEEKFGVIIDYVEKEEQDGNLEHGTCPPIARCPRPEITCRKCWQRYINE